MAETKTAVSRQLIGVQYLRAIAALMVAYVHTQIQIPAYGPILRQYLLGGTHLASGVDLFFVISGYIMVVTSGRATPGDFAVKRLIRIVPLYWVLTIALTLVASMRPELFRTTVTGFVYLVKSLLFLPYPNPGQGGGMAPLLVPGWTLNLEMFFYAIFALVLFVPRSWRIAVTTAVFVLIVGCAPLFKQTAYGAEIGFYGDFRLFEFLGGMLIAHFYSARMPVLAAGLGWTVTTVGFVTLLVGLPFLPLPPGSGIQVLLENALPAAMIVYGALSLEAVLRRRPLRSLTFLGDASYSIYLSHIFMLGAVRFLWAKAGLDHLSVFLAIAFAVTCLSCAVVGGIVVHIALELPMLRILQRIYHARAKSDCALNKANPIATDRKIA